MARCCPLFLTVMPSPYQQQLFSALAAAPDIELSVWYYTAGAADREWSAAKLSTFERILPGRTLSRLGGSAHFNPGILRELRGHNGPVVVSDYSAPTAQLAMWYLTLARRPWAYWGEMPGMRRGFLRGVLRSLLMLPLRLGARAVCAIGEMAAERYGETLGRSKQVFNIPYFCDLQPYLSAPRTPRQGVTVLYCGQFIHRKGLDVLLSAFAKVAGDLPELHLKLVGGVASAVGLERLPEEARSRVSVEGFIQPADLPGLYAAADVLVLPSRHDGWGLVVNEALGAGLPVVVSDRVGAGRDLVKDGENGFVFPSGDVDALASCLVRLAESEALRKRFGHASRERAASFGLDEGVRRWRAALEHLGG